MAGFTIDLAGRVKNFDLPKTQPLIPLFEAVVNSIYAIEERQQQLEFDGCIEIRIIREPQGVAEIEGIDTSINSILPPFFAFAKNIKTRDVYIKVKIRDKTKGKVFCVSFHFARFSIPKVLPYA